MQISSLISRYLLPQPLAYPFVKIFPEMVVRLRRSATYSLLNFETVEIGRDGPHKNIFHEDFLIPLAF